MANKNPQNKPAYLILNAQAFPLIKQVTTIGRKLDNDLNLISLCETSDAIEPGLPIDKNESSSVKSST